MVQEAAVRPREDCTWPRDGCSGGERWPPYVEVGPPVSVSNALQGCQNTFPLPGTPSSPHRTRACRTPPPRRGPTGTGPARARRGRRGAAALAGTLHARPARTAHAGRGVRGRASVVAPRTRARDTHLTRWRTVVAVRWARVRARGPRVSFPLPERTFAVATDATIEGGARG